MTTVTLPLTSVNTAVPVSPELFSAANCTIMLLAAKVPAIAGRPDAVLIAAGTLTVGIAGTTTVGGTTTLPGPQPASSASKPALQTIPSRPMIFISPPELKVVMG